jgi:protein-tyrosine sulfotransferase
MAGSPLRTRVRNRLERARQHRWRTAPYRSDEAHIVMGGAPRSGTTVLRRLLDRHPDVCAGPETKLFVPAAFNLEFLAGAYEVPLPELQAMRAAAPSQGAFIDAFAARVRAAAGKARWAEKTPQNIRCLDWIGERFPRASVLHIIRDGRDVICSMRRHPDWRWVDGAWQKVLVERPLEWYARRWLADTAAGMGWRGRPRYVELRYEDLVTDPLAVLRETGTGLGLTADEGWLESAIGRADVAQAGSAGHTQRPDYEGAVSGASVGRWREDLGADERRQVERLCGPRLRELGYEV